MAFIIAGALLGGLVLDALLSKDGNTKAQVAVDALTKDITNVINNTSTFVNKYVDVSQNVTFSVGQTGSVTCTDGGTLINQTISGDIKFYDQVTNDTVTNIQKLIENNVNSSLDQTSKEVKDFLSGSSGGDVTANIKTRINNIIETNITTNSLIQIMQDFAFSQNAAITINGMYHGPCTIDQTILIRIVSSTIANNIVNVVSQDSSITDISNALKQASERESKGLGDFIKEAFDGLSSGLKLIVIAIVIIAIIALIGGVLYLIIQSKQSSAGTKGYMKNPIYRTSTTMSS